MIETDRPLNIQLPEAAFQAVVSGEKAMISTRRNARKDRFFEAKRPRWARIRSETTGQSVTRAISRVEGTDTDWRVFVA